MLVVERPGRNNDEKDNCCASEADVDAVIDVLSGVAGDECGKLARDQSNVKQLRDNVPRQ